MTMTERINYKVRGLEMLVLAAGAVVIGIGKRDLPNMFVSMMIVAVMGIGLAGFFAWRYFASERPGYVSMSRVRKRYGFLFLLIFAAIFGLLNGMVPALIKGVSQEQLGFTDENAAFIFAVLFTVMLAVMFYVGISGAEEMNAKEYVNIAGKLGFAASTQPDEAYGTVTAVYADGEQISKLVVFDTVSEAERAYTYFVSSRRGRNTVHRHGKTGRKVELQKIPETDTKYLRKMLTDDDVMDVPVCRYEAECGNKFCAATISGHAVTFTETSMYHMQDAKKLIKKLNVC